MGLAAAIGLGSMQPADAQQRKSIRWATSSVDSYGYKVAASMVKIVEEALGGEYTVTVNPYPSTTGAMKAAMDGNGEIGYTADVGMTRALCAAKAASRTTSRPRASWCTPGTPIRWNRSWRCRPRRPRSTSA